MGENTAAVEEMAAQLAAVLRVEGNKGREAWSQLHGKLAEVASVAGDEPKTAVQGLLKVAKDASSSKTLVERVSKVNLGLLKNLVRLVADSLDMTPLCDSGEAVHMVDKDSKFCESNVDNIINRSAELSAPNAPYAVVSIIGAQSSGKSYLLNHLFGTRFPEMDAKLGWTQTTRGIMMSRCIGPSLVLLDVEGYDGRENEEDTSFEKQSALFALAVSDLMIVNMNIADMNRGQASGKVLFETIFKERIKIKEAGFTKILVVFRDYNGETPLDILKRENMKRLEQMWKCVNGVSRNLEDYIKVDIFGMPNKDADKFPKQVTQLRRLLSENRGPENNKVPASGFSESSKKIWEDIKQNKELNIPSHQVFIAGLRCQRLREDILNALDSHKEYTDLKDQESPSHFKEKSDALLQRITNEYDIQTEFYDPRVTAEERKYMVEKLHEILTKHAREMIWKVHEKTLENHKGLFDQNIQNKKEADADAYGEEIVAKCTESFNNSFEVHNLFDSNYLKRICTELEKKMQSHTAICIQRMKAERATEEIEKMKSTIERLKLGFVLLGCAARGVSGSFS